MSKHIFSELKDLEGKVIVKVQGFYSGIGISTETGFLFLKARIDYDNAEIDIETDRDEIMRDWANDNLIKLGFVTQEELDTARQARKEMFEKRQEAAERRHYEKLKKRFDGQ